MAKRIFLIHVASAIFIYIFIKFSPIYKSSLNN